MTAALIAKGHHYRLEYVLGAQHDDAKVFNRALHEALEWLWRGYPIP